MMATIRRASPLDRIMRSVERPSVCWIAVIAPREAQRFPRRRAAPEKPASPQISAGRIERVIREERDR